MSEMTDPTAGERECTPGVADDPRGPNFAGGPVMHTGDHPGTDPGDGRTQCPTCGKWVWLVTHSCKGVRVYPPATPDATDASEPLSECQMYGEPGQTCLTAGPQVVAAEGLCGPCAVRELAAAATKARAEAWHEGFGTGVAYERDRGQWFPPIQRPTAGEVHPEGRDNA